MTDEELFERARQIPGGQQAEFLRENGSGDLQFDRVMQLLDADEVADSLLDLPSTSDVQTASSLPAKEQIGNYKLIQKIGEGGMGSVYMAEQLRPVKRMVALKLVKAGMDSKQVIARFEAERQSLAMMDHPNIAKVLDAGSTDNGEPFFVMELVKGIPIHEYCDQNRLSTEQRVKLMVEVCSAVQHAHQKGIIHRDLKPSNILVAQYDDRPVPKVIDFGVAKATHQKLTETTLYTQLGQIVGTLEYMSPEQAVLNQLDVDTRTDVYSLGVILYELLVGETPLNSKELRSQGLEQILRIIREQEPARPSLRFSSQGEASTQTAAYRNTDQGSLSRSLRGDLDWIVMKALEKDRTRRYDTASRMADDLSNYLNGSIVEARKPTFAYRTAKAWNRNRIQLCSSGAVILALAVGMVGMWNRQRELERTLLARNMAIANWHQSLIERGIEAALRGDSQEADQIAVEATLAAAPKEFILLIQGLAYQFDGNNPRASRLLAEAYELSPNNLGIASALKMAAIGDVGLYVSESRDSRADGLEWSLFELEPTAAYERYELLFRGWSQVYEDPTEAIKTIERVIDSDRPWPFAQAMMAMCLFHEAYDTGEAKYALDGLQNIRQFEERGPESPFILFVGLHCRLAACLFASEQVNSSLLLEEIKDIAQAMDRFPNGWAADSRFAYYELVNSPDLAEKYALARNDWWQALRAAVLLRYDESWSRDYLQSEPRNKPLRAIGEACALAIVGEHDRATEVYSALDESAAFLTRSAALEILMLLGEQSLAKKQSEKLLTALHEDRGIIDTPFNNYESLLTFICGGAEEELLSKVGGSLTGLCAAHYLIGLRLRALGDNRCFEHFRQCVETKQIWMRQYHFSKTLLLREGKPVPSILSIGS